ncbi:MAG: exopolysaccharide biosynthesis-like protein [Firmicutes bacterium]|nr:exopolysaccharide biosynthesis-like protein [Bacillota bacterium]
MVEYNKIDLTVMRGIIRQRETKRQLLAIIIGITLLAIGIALILPERFESTVLLRAKSGKNGIGGSANLQSTAVMLLGDNAVSPIQTYIEMIKSRTVLSPLIADLDKPDDDKEKYTYRDFAKEHLDIKNPKGTEIIELTVTGDTPREAQQMAQKVSTNFLNLLNNLNQNEQSVLVKFLNKRIEVAEAELAKAEKNLVDFQQQEKIIDLDGQGKNLVEALLEYDKRLAELNICSEVEKVKLSSIEQELAKQEQAINNFQITDNQSLEQIRTTIISKELELLDLKQKYKENHPLIKQKKRYIEELNDKMRQETGQAVAARTATLNPVQAEILKQKILTEVEIAVLRTTKEAVEEERAKREQALSTLAANGLNYFQLMRRATIAREVYSVIVKSYEQARIQEAMDSMEVQVVDVADMPKKKSWPRRCLVVLAGVVLGTMLACGYAVFLYYCSSKRNILKAGL